MSYLRGILFENLGLKLVAVLLALVVYVHVYTDRPASMTLTFPVEITNLPDTLAVTHQSPSTVTAELRATGKQLLRLRLTEPSIKIPMGGVHAGRFRHKLTMGDLPLPEQEGFEILRVAGPGTVEMDIERVVARAMPVAARIEGPPPGVVWSGEWSAEPSTVILRGPRSVVMQRDSLVLSFVRIEGRGDTLQVVTGFDSVPPASVTEPATVTLRIPIQRVRS